MDLTHKHRDFKADCTESLLYVSLYSLFPATINLFLLFIQSRRPWKLDSTLESAEEFKLVFAVSPFVGNLVTFFVYKISAMQKYKQISLFTLLM